MNGGVFAAQSVRGPIDLIAARNSSLGFRLPRGTELQLRNTHLWKGG